MANVFALGNRLDFATFNQSDGVLAEGAKDELGNPVTSQTVANSRKTIGMVGSGFIEMLARQMTADLQAIRDRTPPGGSNALVAKGLSFGIIRRRPDGTWDASKVLAISALSLKTTDPTCPPSLVIRPFFQAANVVSLREFTNNAFNQHHGIQLWRWRRR